MLKLLFNKVFTLVELLIVIAIIAILMTLLLPALKKAKETSKKIKCSNNLKQFGVAVNMYAIDYDDYLPGEYWYHPEERGYILHYIGGNAPGPDSAIRRDYNVWSCPSDRYYGPSQFGNLYFPDYGSYAANRYLLREPHKRSKVQAATSKIGVFVDGNFRITTESTVATEGYYGESYCAFGRHAGFNNILFLDGHVGSRKGYGVIDSSGSGPWQDEIVWDLNVYAW